MAELAEAADPGVLATPSGRFFGFVIGGNQPASLAADRLTAAWDQNAGLYAVSPAASVVEETAGRSLLELFGLPDHASVGYVTGGQMANYTGLAAARHEVLRRAGWDVEADGLVGAPAVRVLVGATRTGATMTSTPVQWCALSRTREHVWMSGTTWRDRAAMRISVSNWSTDEDDVDRSVAAILSCARNG